MVEQRRWCRPIDLARGQGEATHFQREGTATRSCAPALGARFTRVPSTQRLPPERHCLPLPTLHVSTLWLQLLWYRSLPVQSAAKRRKHFATRSFGAETTLLARRVADVHSLVSRAHSVATSPTHDTVLAELEWFAKVPHRTTALHTLQIESSLDRGEDLGLNAVGKGGISIVSPEPRSARAAFRLTTPLRPWLQCPPR